MNGRDVRMGVCLCVEDMERMVQFYRDTLGFTAKRNGAFTELETSSGALSFFMYDRKLFAQAFGESYVPPKGINQTFEIALWLPSFADVDAEYERLSELDIKFPSGAPITYDWGIRNFYVADPEGNLLEIGSISEGKNI